MRYHLIAVGMVIMKRTRDNKCWLRFGEKEILIYYWWEGILVTVIMENGIEVPQKVNNRTFILPYNLQYDPAIPLLAIYLKETKSLF